MATFRHSERIVVYGAQYCGLCSNTKAMLEKAHAKFAYLDVQDEATQVVFKELQGKYNYATIPMIFINEKLIGGYR